LRQIEKSFDENHDLMVEKTKIILPIFIQTQPHFIKFKNLDHSYKNHKHLTCTTRIHHSIDTTPCKHQSITNPTIKVTPSIPSQQAPRMTTRPPTTPPSLLFSNSDLITVLSTTLASSTSSSPSDPTLDQSPSSTSSQS
jgi:hypothetical protein